MPLFWQVVIRRSVKRNGLDGQSDYTPRCMDCAFFHGDREETWAHRHAKHGCFGSVLAYPTPSLDSPQCTVSLAVYNKKNTSLGCKPQPRTQILLYIRRRMFVGLAGHLLVSAYREASLSFVFLNITRSALHGCFIWQMIFVNAVFEHKIMDLNFLVLHGGIWRRYHSRLLSILQYILDRKERGKHVHAHNRFFFLDV